MLLSLISACVTAVRANAKSKKQGNPGDPVYSNVVDDKRYFIGRNQLSAVILGMKTDRHMLKAEFDVIF